MFSVMCANAIDIDINIDIDIDIDISIRPNSLCTGCICKANKVRPNTNISRPEVDMATKETSRVSRRFS